MLDIFCPKLHLCPKPLPPLSKKWGKFGLKVSFYFSYSRHKCNCWLKIVNHWDKRDTGVMCTGKEIKSGLKLIRMETDSNVYMRKKQERWDINIVLL